MRLKIASLVVICNILVALTYVPNIVSGTDSGTTWLHTDIGIHGRPLSWSPELSTMRGLVQTNTPRRLEAELVTIRPTGFDPSEIRRGPEPFLLAVDNRSGLDEVTLNLTRESDGVAREMRFARGQLKWREKVSLSAGTYLLTEANHPRWTCRIRISP